MPLSTLRSHGPADEGPNEKCGVFGVFGKGEDVARISFFGLFALQHRGQESAGIAVTDGTEIRSRRAMGLVTQVFDERRLKALKSAHIAVGHTRYSTTGAAVIRNAQPVIAHSPYIGDIAVAHNGNLVNTQALHDELEAQGEVFETTNDTEIIARLLALYSKDGIEDAVRKMMTRVEGAYSLAIMTRDRLIGVRDPNGVRPLCVGTLNERGYLLASEPCALPVVGGQFVREIEPGEMVIIDENGLREEVGAEGKGHNTCVFEFIYFARPDSHIYDRTLHTARRRMGHELAREHPCTGAHLVIPIPDSAVPAALGYAEASRIPYAEGLVKNRYIQRTFIQPDQRMRDLGVLMKYSPLREILAGQRVVMVDDSIVRGTTTGKLVRMLKEAGALEVHVRITSPPVRWPCYYGIDMADQDQLIAARKSIEEICEWIGATSLGYLSLEGVVRAVGVRKSKFCRACFDGKYPIAVPAKLKFSKLMLEEGCAPSPDAEHNALAFAVGATEDESMTNLEEAEG